MKNSLLSLSALLFLCNVLTAQPAPKSATPTFPGKSVTGPHTMDPIARSNMLARTGGFVFSAYTGPAILFLNTQKRIPAPVLHEIPENIQKILRLHCETENRFSATPVADAVNTLSNTNIATVVVIGDQPGYPSLLVAPESRWVLVNVAALSGPDVSAEKLAVRVHKEVWRAFGYVMGAANSNFEHCLLRPVLSPNDLDMLTTKNLCPEPFNNIMEHARKLGMQPTRMSTYRKAVEEGWAPAPTNDFQRAIWQEIKK